MSRQTKSNQSKREAGLVWSGQWTHPDEKALVRQQVSNLPKTRKIKEDNGWKP